MHNNKPIKHHEKGFVYIKKADLDNATTYGLFNNMNEKEEYTRNKPKPKKNTYYKIEILGTEKYDWNNPYAFCLYTYWIENYYFSLFNRGYLFYI